MSAAIKRMGAPEWLFLIILSSVWGSSFIFVELALPGFSPLLLVFLRILIGAIVLTAFLLFSKVYLPLDWRMWLLFFGMGLLQNSVPFWLIAWGQQHISASLTGILNATIPFISLILAHVFTQNEKINLVKGIGLVLGIGGVASILGLEVIKEFKLENLGTLAVLGAALCYATSMIWGLKFSGLKPGVAATGMLWCSVVTLLPFLFFSSEGLVRELSVTPVLSVIGLGVLCTALAYILFFLLLDRAGATATSMVAFLIPVSTLVLAWFFLGEKISTDDVPGIIMVFTGLLLIDGRALSFFRLRRV